ncbi:CcoQ/FixQ family Cbb3-type cytochrome c oxidase assembly chaperone [Antarcticibacterium sp. 1MA-6-2]|uniref:CcoQ/FixQ family Cbb3-type cytochrome c oxidase assembly chaperone n=1 Tax=Antarcticibacterium sp. 1MA-6-2 TaxID=2908210 RepID=UPI001F42F6A7|nr:CcoQ/FixQ family Cbb3-type cytochrome c oxidase assembly chaperone [Antarcticibacterium sp. 1MA-6-2]UJH90841.1 CcoQ/FixQ family Cbb3-type cytochrome c oxidase assembly chaperone [Antarcticibacterium sp. 1MA-6-2]
MFKFIKGHMETIAGVEVYPIISLLIFFIFFVLLFWWVLTANKEYIKGMEEIPLESENEQTL